MTTVQLPTNFDLPHFSAAYELDGTTYDFTFFANRRDDAFYMDIELRGEMLVRGVRLVTGKDLLEPHRYKDVPQGTLRLVDLDQQDSDPSEENFGDRVVLVYDQVN